MLPLVERPVLQGTGIAVTEAGTVVQKIPANVVSVLVVTPVAVVQPAGMGPVILVKL